ncbi:transposase [Jannaschia seohaensis]|uniref:transposase n=1 Tax=Jannaschia seohaensis TaxID=475081 RepID=UPI00387E4094
MAFPPRVLGDSTFPSGLGSRTARGHSWISDAEWARNAPHLPFGQRRAWRVDDRRVISLHMLRPGARWRPCPAVRGQYKTVDNRFNRWPRQSVAHGIYGAGRPYRHPRVACGGLDRRAPREGPPLGGRRKRGGAFAQGIGCSRRGGVQAARAGQARYGSDRPAITFRRVSIS